MFTLYNTQREQWSVEKEKEIAKICCSPPWCHLVLEEKTNIFQLAPENIDFTLLTYFCSAQWRDVFFLGQGVLYIWWRWHIVCSYSPVMYSILQCTSNAFRQSLYLTICWVYIKMLFDVFVNYQGIWFILYANEVVLSTDLKIF